MTTSTDNSPATWAEPIHRLRVSTPPADVVNLNVNGRRLIGTVQGFGQLWERTYRVTLNSELSPQQVVGTWKEHFGEFWPKGNKFVGSGCSIAPGDVALLNLTPVPGPLVLSTGIAVIYADDVSFTFMAPEGHMYAGWITFSADRQGDLTYAQAQVLVRTSDPAWEVVMRLFAFKFEDAFWRATLANLAAYFDVRADSVSQQLKLVDDRLQWRRAWNIWRNAAMWSGLHMAAAPLRKLSRQG
jgi:hypothetical protein